MTQADDLFGWPAGEIRADELKDKLMIHIDDPTDPHPLAKKAWLMGRPVPVER